MKKHVRKIIALLLVISLFPVLPASVFAEEADGNTIPEGATRHTIELTVEPGETLDPSDDSGVSPYIWNQGTYYPPTNGGVTHIPPFTIPDRYFAYEATVRGNGSGSCAISLVLVSVNVSIANLQVDVNCHEKLDWIDVNAGSSYKFIITNNTTSTVTVELTYYSWV